MKKINLLDLFSGIGGFHLGLSQAGFKVNSFYSEIDKYALKTWLRDQATRSRGNKRIPQPFTRCDKTLSFKGKPKPGDRLQKPCRGVSEMGEARSRPARCGRIAQAESRCRKRLAYKRRVAGSAG